MCSQPVFLLTPGWSHAWLRRDSYQRAEDIAAQTTAIALEIAALQSQGAATADTVRRYDIRFLQQACDTAADSAPASAAPAAADEQALALELANTLSPADEAAADAAFVAMVAAGGATIQLADGVFAADSNAARAAASITAGAVAQASRSGSTSIADFNTWHYIQHNQRRQEHLATLGLDLAQVRFQQKNPEFLIRNPDLLTRNLDFLLKTDDFIIKQKSVLEVGAGIGIRFCI